MKRVGIAAVLLAVVVILSGGAILLQHHATERLVASCDNLIALYQSGDIDACREAARELSDNLETDMKWFPFFLKHERMESIFQQAGSLPYLVSDDDPADFFATLAAMRVQLEILMDNEWPTPENIM